jgi:drug/metabolite transporter (DMT)-like permease
MTGLALGLILLSAVAHATWNLLVKRTTNQELFIWWIIVSISIIVAPLAIFLFVQYPVEPPGWWFVLGTIILHALYFVLLGRSYAHADFSLVYPIARGIGPSLVPVLGVLILRESITPLAVVGIIMVIIGIYTVYWWGRIRQLLRDPFRLFREAGARYAILTGLVNAVQSVWDKVGVQYVNPFLYMYLLALGGVLVLAPYMIPYHGMGAVRSEGRRNIKIIPVAGLLMFCAYGLVLLAMQFTQVSYIIPAREIGIVFGVILGMILLREPFGRGRIIGSCLIAFGVSFISLAR